MREGERERRNIIIPWKIKCIPVYIYVNLELSEWFMIKSSKQQPLMSQRNLFKYLFVCELLPLWLMYTQQYVYFLPFQVTLNTFQASISAWSKTKTRNNVFFLSFLSSFSFSISSNFGSSSVLRTILVPHIDLTHKTPKTHKTKSTEENVEKVLVNGVAEIKCDVASSIDGDQVLLVVWYKNNLPIYR